MEIYKIIILVLFWTIALSVVITGFLITIKKKRDKQIARIYNKVFQDKSRKNINTNKRYNNKHLNKIDN